MAYKWGQGAGGAASGAATGGSVGGPPGAVVGGILGALSGFGGGGRHSNRMKKVPTMTKEQEGVLNQILQMIGPGGQLGEGYGKSLDLQQQMMDPNSEAVNQFAAPYQQQFDQQTIPGLAERFAGMGGMGGGLSSSGFGQSLSSAGGNLQTQLAALKAGLGQQAAQGLMGQYGSMAQMGLGAQPFGYQDRPAGAGQNFMNSWMQGGMPGLKEASQFGSDLYQNYGPIIGNV